LQRALQLITNHQRELDAVSCVVIMSIDQLHRPQQQQNQHQLQQQQHCLFCVGKFAACFAPTTRANWTR
jgi:hypothetical protein